MYMCSIGVGVDFLYAEVLASERALNPPCQARAKTARRKISGYDHFGGVVTKQAMYPVPTYDAR